jgi:hypothetical protein
VIENRSGAMIVIATISRELRDHERPLFEGDLIDAFRGHDVEPGEVRQALRTMVATGMVQQPADRWSSAP